MNNIYCKPEFRLTNACFGGIKWVNGRTYVVVIEVARATSRLSRANTVNLP